MVDIVVLPKGFQTPSAPLILSLTPLFGTLCSLMVSYKPLPLYLSGFCRASQETAISGSSEYELLGIHNNLCIVTVYCMNLQVEQSLDGPSFRLLYTFSLYLVL